MEKNRSGLFVYYRWLVLLLAAGLCLLPLWATVMGGFKSPGDLRTNAFGLPRQWLTDNYVSIATGGRFGPRRTASSRDSVTRTGRPWRTASVRATAPTSLATLPPKAPPFANGVTGSAAYAVTNYFAGYAFGGSDIIPAIRVQNTNALSNPTVNYEIILDYGVTTALVDYDNPRTCCDTVFTGSTAIAGTPFLSGMP